MANLTSAEIWTAALAAISAFILICNGVEKTVDGTTTGELDSTKI